MHHRSRPPWLAFAPILFTLLGVLAACGDEGPSPAPPPPPSDPLVYDASAETRREVGIAKWGFAHGVDGAATFRGYDAKNELLVEIRLTLEQPDALTRRFAMTMTGKAASGSQRIEYVARSSDDWERMVYAQSVAENTFVPGTLAATILARLAPDSRAIPMDGLAGDAGGLTTRVKPLDGEPSLVADEPTELIDCCGQVTAESAAVAALAGSSCSMVTAGTATITPRDGDLFDYLKQSAQCAANNAAECLSTASVMQPLATAALGVCATAACSKKSKGAAPASTPIERPSYAPEGFYPNQESVGGYYGPCGPLSATWLMTWYVGRGPGRTKTNQAAYERASDLAQGDRVLPGSSPSGLAYAMNRMLDGSVYENLARHRKGASMEDIRGLVEKGRPVITLIQWKDPGNTLPTLHYVTVFGFRRENDSYTYLVHDNGSFKEIGEAELDRARNTSFYDKAIVYIDRSVGVTLPSK